MPAPLVKKRCLLKKIPGKGGWTYAELPEVPVDRSAPFGWVRVKGSIDGYRFEKYHLMPLGNGHLFLPVKAAVRKQIRKQAGDHVDVEIYLDDAAIEIPPELDECLDTEPAARSFFLSLTQSQQKHYIDWIFSAARQETRDQRLARCIDLLLKGQPLRSAEKQLNP